MDEKNLDKLTIQVFGWKEKFKKILSEIFIANENYELEIVKIIFTSDGFLTLFLANKFQQKLIGWGNLKMNFLSHHSAKIIHYQKS